MQVLPERKHRRLPWEVIVPIADVVLNTTTVIPRENYLLLNVDLE
jgi:hypothetical protein